MDDKKPEPARAPVFFWGRSVARLIQAAERLHDHLRLFLVYVLTRAGHRVECEIQDLLGQELALVGFDSAGMVYPTDQQPNRHTDGLQTILQRLAFFGLRHASKGIDRAIDIGSLSRGVLADHARSHP